MKQAASKHFLAACFMLGLFFNPEDGGDMFLRTKPATPINDILFVPRLLMIGRDLSAEIIAYSGFSLGARRCLCPHDRNVDLTDCTISAIIHSPT
jgi:hypothetical protein